MKKIALGQMNVEYGNFEKNLNNGLNYIEKAIQANCDLILLPELWTTGFDLETNLKFYQNNSQTIDKLQAISDQHKITICGSLILLERDQYFNTFVAIRPHQQPIFYNKNHLFSPMYEDKYFSKGESIIQFETTLGKTGSAICFDLRFPEMFTTMSENGVEFFLIPAHWPLVRVLHWDVLLQARAIENQAFVIAVNSVGKSGNYLYAGHSTIISPDGEILLRAPSDLDGVYTCEIDPDYVDVCRERLRIRKK